MLRSWIWLPTLAGTLCAALAGCSHDHVLVVRQSAGESPVSLALHGSDTQMRIAFPSGNQTVRPGEFKPDEICYLTFDNCRINCSTTGSSLDLGPTDSNDLLTDNPMWGIAPADNNAFAAQTMKLYGVLFLVAGSVDRLPDTLADYIQSPGSHLIEVLSLTDALLNQKHVQFRGFAPGGNFTVTVELTDAGRNKLLDALDEVGESAGRTQWVQFHDRVPRSPTIRAANSKHGPDLTIRAPSRAPTLPK